MYLGKVSRAENAELSLTDLPIIGSQTMSAKTGISLIIDMHLERTPNMVLHSCILSNMISPNFSKLLGYQTTIYFHSRKVSARLDQVFSSLRSYLWIQSHRLDCAFESTSSIGLLQEDDASSTQVLLPGYSTTVSVFILLRLVGRTGNNYEDQR